MAIIFKEDNMKRVLVVLLMLTVVGGAFAQKVDISASGVASLNFGAGIDFGYKDDNPATPWDERDSEASWMFGPCDAKIGATGVAGPVSANVTLQAASGTAKLDGWFAAVGSKSVEFKVGLGFLPWIQWSSIDFMGDNNYCVGASAVKDTYLQLKYGKDGISIYGGLMEAGVNEQTIKDNAVFPGFYIGGDFGKDKLSVGAAFAGVPRGENWYNSGGESRFGWMGDLHVRINGDPISLGLNVAMYGDPSINESWWTPDFDPFHIVTGGKKDFILEGMFDLGIGLDPCNIGIAAGIVTNLASKDDHGGGAGLQLGANATFTLGGGFSFTPGVIVMLPLKTQGAEDPSWKGAMNIGATMGYSF
jgi:hypothetical protein